MHVAFVAYPVRDLERSIAFYRDVCGFGKGERLSPSYVEFDVGGVGFALDTTTEYFGVAPGSGFGFAVETDDLAAVRARLETAGAKIDGYAGPRCAAIFARDPDGNVVAFHTMIDGSKRND